MTPKDGTRSERRPLREVSWQIVTAAALVVAVVLCAGWVWLWREWSHAAQAVEDAEVADLDAEFVSWFGTGSEAGGR